MDPACFCTGGLSLPSRNESELRSRGPASHWRPLSLCRLGSVSELSEGHHETTVTTQAATVARHCAVPSLKRDLGNPQRRVNRLEAAYLSDRRPNVRTVPTQAEPLRSCRVNLFCPSLYVGHVVDQRCSRMAAALHDISHWP